MGKGGGALLYKKLYKKIVQEKKTSYFTVCVSAMKSIFVILVMPVWNVDLTKFTTYQYWEDKNIKCVRVYICMRLDGGIEIRRSVENVSGWKTKSKYCAWV